MSILEQVEEAREAYTLEYGHEPVCVLLHPLTIGRASVEAWEQDEDKGIYGFPARLSSIHGLHLITDWKADEGEVWVGTEGDYEALCTGRIVAWRMVNGMGD